jgi:hypothetical protein
MEVSAPALSMLEAQKQTGPGAARRYDIRRLRVLAAADHRNTGNPAEAAAAAAEGITWLVGGGGAWCRCATREPLQIGDIPGCSG